MTEIFRDTTGALSSKRVAGFIGLTAALVAGGFDKLDAMNSFLMFTGAALGISGLEKFAPPPRNNNDLPL